jgi:hypothetical protein
MIHNGRLDPSIDLLVEPFTFATKLRQMLEISGTP